MKYLNLCVLAYDPNRPLLKATIISCLLAISGCASQWKIHGGPEECKAMCKNWGLEFAGMVGVGNQDASGPGATACICQVKNVGGSVSSRESSGASSSAGLAGPITAEQAAAAAQLAVQQQRLNQPNPYNSNYRYDGYGVRY